MICRNIKRIRAEVRETALHCGRDPDAVRLVAVSKRMPVEAVAAACQCGQLLFGENYLQDAVGKIERVEQAQWHFIGHLQSNKAGTAAKLFQMIETVDRLKIAQALDRHAGRLNKKLEVLVQVNVGREPQKSGIAPEHAEALLREIQPLPNLKVRGLMTMPPYGHAPEASRLWFRTLKELADRFAAEALFADDNTSVELSMGMSGDFKVAIEEGATMIRIGTAIFGKRPV